MWMGSPILAAFESASGRIGKSFPGIFRRARSRPDILPSGSSPTESGGLYFFTSARTRVPLERTTKIPGSSLTFVEGRTLSRACCLTRSSATTSATIRATAGLARRIASWTVSVRSAPASPAQLSTRLNARPVVARMRGRGRLIVGILYLLGGEKKKAPGEPPAAFCNRGNLLLLQDRHGGLGLLGRLGHVARLARRFGFVHEDPSLVSARC